MSLPFDSERLSVLRHEVGLLVQRAGAHEDDLKALVAAAETSVRCAEEALTDAVGTAHRGGARLQALLSAQLQRTQAGAETARQLCIDAHEQRVAAGLLLTQLDCDLATRQGTEKRRHRDAVLVVDDYGAVREALAEVLRGAGFVVRTAANGLEGLLAAYEMRPAVILMDVTMPVLDGIEATRLIKAAEATRQARVIAYTGTPPSGESLAHQMFAAVLQKPATPAAVLATVQHVASL